MKPLQGKTALLTGASNGLGLYIGRALAKKGVNLALLARSEQKLKEVAEELSTFGIQTLAVPFDLYNTADIQSQLETIQQELGSIDILINNAAIERVANYSTQSEAEIEQTLFVNLHAPLILSRLILPSMIKNGSGHIINISSIAGKKGLPYNALYSASKAGLIEWTNAIQFELSGTGVFASVVSPGFIDDAGKFARDGLKAPKLVGALKPDQVADIIVEVLYSKKREVYATPSPIRSLLAINALSPKLGDKVIKLLGIPEMFEEIIN